MICPPPLLHFPLSLRCRVCIVACINFLLWQFNRCKYVFWLFYSPSSLTCLPTLSTFTPYKSLSHIHVFFLVLWYTEFNHDCQYHYRFQTIQWKPVSLLWIRSEVNVGPPSLFTSSQKFCSLHCAPMISSLIMADWWKAQPVQASACHHMGFDSHDCNGHDTSSTQHLMPFSLHLPYIFFLPFIPWYFMTLRRCGKVVYMLLSAKQSVVTYS